MDDMRLTLVINSLDGGGAERVLSSMAAWWAARGHTVNFITLAGCQHDFYPLEFPIRRIALDLNAPSPGITQKLFNNLERLRALRSAILETRPTAVISFMDRINVLTLLATRGTRLPVLVSERGNPEVHPIGRGWAQLRRLAYPHAERLVLQTEAIVPWARRELPTTRTAVIPNPLWAPLLPARTHEPPLQPGLRLVTLGRLTPAKAYDRLLDAFARIAPRHPDWNLHLYGRGELLPTLTAQRARLGLERRVHFEGVTAYPLQVLENAHLFVLSSEAEGFPNVLLEAMACAVPVVSYDCPFGPAELLDGGRYGTLVPPGSVPALADALDRLMGDPAARLQASALSARGASRYTLDEIMGRWNALLPSGGTE
jgi:glycosyltransferase involved in cell wall biosynthesis